MVVDMFTMTIETVENIAANNTTGDLTSTMNMVVNNKIENGTSVSCRTTTGMMSSLTILKRGIYTMSVV